MLTRGFAVLTLMLGGLARVLAADFAPDGTVRAPETSSNARAPQLEWHWTSDWVAGGKDANGHFMGGTETMSLVAHQGKLYAGIGFWMDTNTGEQQATEPWTGAQVLVKDRPNAPWRVDVSFGANYLRTEALASITLTTDGQGKPLDPPASLLLAGPSDVTVDHERTISAWVRDDYTNTWTESPIATLARRASAERGPTGATDAATNTDRPAHENIGAAGVRSFGAHLDARTGIAAVYAGAARGAIYRAVFDPTAPGKLKWDSEPELAGTGRIMAFAECNGALYACTGLRKDAQGRVHGGLFRRIDGATPRWERIYQWAYTPVVKGDEANLMRGLTAVPAPDGIGQVLLATRNNPGIVERIDPRNHDTVTVELEIRTFFAKAFGIPTYTGPALSAYNHIIPWTDPRSGETLYLLGVWVNHPYRAAHHGAWLLARRQNGDYSFAEVTDPTTPVNSRRGLVATRAIAVSPFPTEAGMLYAGGFDCSDRPSHNTAWIYRSVSPLSASFLQSPVSK